MYDPENVEGAQDLWGNASDNQIKVDMPFNSFLKVTILMSWYDVCLCISRHKVLHWIKLCTCASTFII